MLSLYPVTGEADMGDSSVGRRKCSSLLGSAAAAWPPAPRAQAVPVIGFLNSTSPDPTLQRVAAFREGLREQGYVSRPDVTVEFRWAENQHYRLQSLAADLVRR